MFRYAGTPAVSNGGTHGSHPSPVAVQSAPLRNVRVEDRLMGQKLTREQRGIIAAHEGGNHELPYGKPKPDICRLCQKEQEASLMSKQKVECITCGGSYDGTPSGQKKHEATNRHQEGGYRETPGEQIVAAVEAALASKPEPVTSDDQNFGGEPEPLTVPEAGSRAGALYDQLSDIITERSRERDRRVVDHKWRVANRPDEAQGYFDSKVAPLLKEIEVLQNVKQMIIDLAPAE